MSREDIVIRQRETFEWIFYIKNSDGTDKDLTGINSITMQARKYIDANVAEIDISLGAGIEVTDTAKGEITVTISSPDTGDFDFKILHYDLFYSMDGSVFKKHKHGIIRLEKSVTQ
jgi:hypothetical protein